MIRKTIFTYAIGTTGFSRFFCPVCGEESRFHHSSGVGRCGSCMTVFRQNGKTVLKDYSERRPVKYEISKQNEKKILDKIDRSFLL